METPNFEIFDRWCTKFKSYYVVWKPQKQTIDDDRSLSFKSYYVVWKREYEKRMNLIEAV